MASLLNFLGPILFVVGFYLLLGVVVWWIIHPPRLRLTLPALRLPTVSERLPKDSISRQTFYIAALLLLFGLLGSFLPFALPLRLLAAQAIGAAFLLFWFDNYSQQRQRQAARETLLNALRSPVPHVAQAALISAQQQGWFSDGSMRNQDFRRAQWAGANLNGADLAGANLTAADLSGANLRQAILDKAILSGALLATADLAGATLVGTQLNAIQAKAVNLHQSNCQGANLDGAKLQRANLTNANLNNSTLTHANLKQATLAGVQLREACFDTMTKWPKHFYPELAGAKLKPLPPHEVAQGTL